MKEGWKEGAEGDARKKEDGDVKIGRQGGGMWKRGDQLEDRSEEKKEEERGAVMEKGACDRGGTDRKDERKGSGRQATRSSGVL